MRIQVSMPEEVVKKLDEKAKAMGLSRSAYITAAVSEKMLTSDVMNIMPEVLRHLKADKARLQLEELD